jgi:hypothetical protein
MVEAVLLAALEVVVLPMEQVLVSRGLLGRDMLAETVMETEKRAVAVAHQRLAKHPMAVLVGHRQ